MRKSKKFLLTALAAGMLLAPGMMASAHEEDAVIPEPELPVVNDMSKYMDVANEYFTGTWEYDSNAGKWWFKGDDNTYPYNDIFEVDGVSYGFDESGWMVTGWHYYSLYDAWFYFNDNGVMAKGWVNDGGTWYYTDPENGFMYYDGIYTIDGSDYFLQASGAMAANGWALVERLENSGYEFWVYATESGPLKSGWHYENGSWYYLDKEAYSVPYMVTSFDEIDGIMYVFDQSGRLSTGGWTSYYYTYMDGTSYSMWCYANSDGTAYDGWLKESGNWYYISQGLMATGMYYFEEEDQTYIFDQAGRMVYGGWTNVRNGWYYANADGTGYDGWLKEDGNWYLIYNGWMANNCPERDFLTGKVYFFPKSGVMATTPGWHAAVYEYTEPASVDWFYVKDASGELYADGTWEIDGKEYSFDAFGYCLNP